MYASAYLTLASIIQGVALAALVQRVEATYATFDATCWVMAGTTFVGVLLIWHEYLVQVLGYKWVPTILDSIIPFAFVVGEVFAAHFVAHDVRNWLLAYAGTFMVGIAAGLLTRRKSAAASDRYRQTSKRVVLLIPGITLLAVAASLLYDVLGLYRTQLVVVIVMAALVVTYVIASLGYWGRVATASSGRA